MQWLYELVGLAPATTLQLLCSLHGVHAGDAAQAEDHAVEVAYVFGFGYQFDDGFAVLILADIDAADVGVVVGDNGDQLLQHAHAVVAGDGDLDRVALRPAGVLAAHAGPFDIDAAVALVEQVLHVGTTARMDGHALAASDVADDLFAANGVAATRTINQKIVLAFNLERIRAGQVQLAHRVGHGCRSAGLDLRRGFSLRQGG